MRRRTLDRREVLGLLTAAAALPGWSAAAEEVIALYWEDLLPEGSPAPDALQGIIDHSGASMLSQQPPSSGVRDDWNGRMVRMPGYMVPLDYDGAGVTTFILVPYIGACIHVPPPPANQLVLVTSEKPYETSGLFEAVNVTGVFGTTAISTDLAQIGYEMAARQIEPYRY